MKKLGYFVLELCIFALLIFLWRVAHYEYYQPTRNSHPDKFFTIKGYVAPSLRSHVHLAWQGRYSTSKKQCDEIYNHIEGVIGARVKTINFSVSINKQGKFLVKVPYDYFDFGRCGWQLSHLDDNTKLFEQDFGLTSNIFLPCGNSEDCDDWAGKLAKHYQNNAHFWVYCDGQKCQVSKKSYLFNNDAYYLPRNPRFVLHESFLLGEGR